MAIKLTCVNQHEVYNTKIKGTTKYPRAQTVNPELANTIPRYVHVTQSASTICLFIKINSFNRFYLKLKFAFKQQTTEEDPDEGIKDLVDICLKKIVSYSNFFHSVSDRLCSMQSMCEQHRARFYEMSDPKAKKKLLGSMSSVENLSSISSCDGRYHELFNGCFLALLMKDFDHDGRLSFEDYSQAVDADTLLLEVLGQCLPDTKVSFCICGGYYFNLVHCNKILLTYLAITCMCIQGVSH